MAEKKEKKQTDPIVDVKELLRSRFPDFEAWQKEYSPRKLNVIEVDDKIAVLKPIGAEEVAAYSMALVDPEKGLVVATRYLLEELWLDGDAIIREDEEYFIAAMMQVQNVVETKKSRFTKL